MSASNDQEPTPSDPLDRLLAHALGLGSGDARDRFLAGLDRSDPAKGAEVRSLVSLLQQNEWRERHEPRVDDVIGRYRLVQKLGEGGFGTVWRARRTDIELPDVALKWLHGHRMSAIDLSRFERERSALARITHSGVVRVIDAGTADEGRAFLAMEYVDGPAITRYAKEHELELNARVRLLQQVALAVHAAHEAGVLHRDLKPSNVLVAQEDGRPSVKIVDFGLTSVFDGSGDRGVTLTGEGDFLGSPGYMAPEQAGMAQAGLDPDRSGEPHDARCDVFAFGRLAFEVVTGHPAIMISEGPFATRVEELRRAFENHLPGPGASRRARVPRDLDAVMRKAMSVERSQRYRSMAELNDELERFLQGRPVRALRANRIAAARRFARRHAGVLIPAAMVTALLAGLVGVLHASRAKIQEANDSLSLVALQQSRMLEELDPERVAVLVRRDLEEQLAESSADPDSLIAVLDGLDLTSASSRALEATIVAPAEAAIRDLPNGAQAGLLETLAVLRGRFGMLDEALQCALAGIEAARAAHGVGAPQAVDLALRAASFERRTGRYDDALVRLEAIVDPPPGHPDVSDTQRLRARTERAAIAMKKLDEPAMRASLEGLRDELEFESAGPRTHVEDAWIAVASCEELLGSPANARVALEAAAAAGGPTFRRNDVLTVDANLLRVGARLGEAAGLVDEAERVDTEYVRFFGRAHPKRIRFLNTKAIVQNLGGEPDRALETSVKALELARSRHAFPQVEVLSLGANVAMQCLGAGQIERARRIAAETLDDALGLGPESAPQASALRFVDATARVLLGERAEVEADLLAVVAEFKEQLDDRHPRYVAAVQLLVDFYGDWPDTERDLSEETTRWSQELQRVTGNGTVVGAGDVRAVEASASQ